MSITSMSLKRQCKWSIWYLLKHSYIHKLFHRFHIFVFLFFMMIWKKIPKSLLYSFQHLFFLNSWCNEYNQFHSRNTMISSFSRLDLSIQNLRCKLLELKKYGPYSNTLSLSFAVAKIVLNKFLDSSFMFTCPLGFRIDNIHQTKYFFIG